MKKKSLIFVVVGFILALSLIAGCVTANKAISEEEFFKSWSGEWVNTDIPGNTWVPQKIVAYPDGTHDIYVYASDSINFCQHEITLIDQWVDSKGTIWYKAKGKCPKGMEGYEFGKISNSGNTLEYLYNTTNEPIEKWEPDYEYYNYCIFYRE